MNPYWITFEDGSKGCCEGESAYDAKRIAEHLTGKKVSPVAPISNTGDLRNGEVLPYPADPIIWQFDHPVIGICPPFCTSPEKCKGRTSCPKSYACSE